MAELNFEKNSKFLEKGIYSPKDLIELGIYCTNIKKIVLDCNINIVIIPNTKKDVEYEFENTTDKKKKIKVDIRIHKCANIIIRCVSSLWDYIIVGLGSSGSILARKLTDDLKTRVLVIESGINHQDDPVVLDPNWVPHATKFLYDPEYSVTYPVPIDPITKPFVAIPYSEGRMWGGSSGHNFLVAVRGTPTLYDEWAQISGNPMWLYDNMLPYMKAIETYTPNGSLVNFLERGLDGPIGVTQNPPLDQNNAILQQFKDITLSPFIPDYNVPEGAIGIAANQELITGPFGSQTSHRSYSNLEFLPVGKIIDEKGNGLNGRKLKILSNSNVFHFESNNGRADSVVFIENGDVDKVKRAYLKRSGKLILTAGAINTPSILLRSGVGPKSELELLGISVVVDSPNVGKNLQNQYGTAVIATGDMLPNFPQVYTDMYNVNDPGSFPNDDVRRVQILNIRINNFLFQALPSILRPKSRGSVTIVSKNPLFDPKIEMGIFTDDKDGVIPGSDMYTQIAFFNLMKDVVTAAGGVVLFPTPDQYNFGLLTQAAIDANNLVLQSHIVGTTRMAKTINEGVVDGNLKVFGLDNVYIGDIGIEPDSVDGNTCLSAYYISLVLCNILGVPTPPVL